MEIYRLLEGRKRQLLVVKQMRLGGPKTRKITQDEKEIEAESWELMGEGEGANNS